MSPRRSEDSDEIDVWPDMIGAVSTFFGMESQWRWLGAGMAGAFRTGLDYSALPVVTETLQVDRTPQLLHDLRTMESEALAAMSKK